MKRWLFFYLLVGASIVEGTTEKEEALIEEMVTTLGDTGVMGLINKRSHLNNLGKQLENLHPLDFIGSIIKNRELKVKMHKVMKSSVKWKAFSSEMAKSLHLASQQESFDQKLTLFCKQHGLDLEKAQELSSKRAWNHFLTFVFR